MMKIKITREDGSLHSFDFYKKERCVFSISENGDMYYSIYGNGEFAKTILLGRIYKKLRQEQASLIDGSYKSLQKIRLTH